MMMASKTFLFFFIVYSIIDQGHAFNSQVKKLQFQSVGSKLLRATRQSTSSPSLMTMRDASASYWFQVGDRVRVVDDVPKAGINLRNRVGNVVSSDYCPHIEYAHPKLEAKNSTLIFPSLLQD